MEKLTFQLCIASRGKLYYPISGKSAWHDKQPE